jgi:hypothetical protein
LANGHQHDVVLPHWFPRISAKILSCRAWAKKDKNETIWQFERRSSHHRELAGRFWFKAYPNDPRTLDGERHLLSNPLE